MDAYPDLKWDGIIAEISPQANRAKATVQVKVQILNPDAHLRPDMNATVKFLADENKQTSTQPQGVFVPQRRFMIAMARSSFSWHSMARRCHGK